MLKVEFDEYALGNTCPKCQGHDIKMVGSNPDGINNNTIFECKECGYIYEGL